MKAIWPRNVPHCRKFFLEITIWGPLLSISGRQSWTTTALSGKETVTMKLTKKAAVKLFHHTPITYLLSTLTGLV